MSTSSATEAFTNQAIAVLNSTDVSQTQDAQDLPVSRRSKRNFASRLADAHGDAPAGSQASNVSASTMAVDASDSETEELASSPKRASPLLDISIDSHPEDVEYVPLNANTRLKRATSKRAYPTESPIKKRTTTKKKPSVVKKEPFCDPSLAVPYEEPPSPPYSSSLAGVSIDVARLIWSFLDVDSLALLHCTFNRSVQRMMHSRGAIAQAVLEYGTSIQMWQIRYFLLSLHDVDKLHLDHVQWKPALLARLLRSANPYELVFGQHLVPYSLLTELKKPEECSEETQAVLKCFTPAGLPDFALLTPQLRTITFKHALTAFVEPQQVDRARRRYRYHPYSTSVAFSHGSALSLPPTLESLQLSSLDIFNFNLMLKNIPETIGRIKLNLRDSYNAKDVLQLGRFKYLQELDCGDAAIYAHNAQVTLPTSIESLSLGQFQFYPRDLLNDPSFTIAPLKHLKIGITEPSASPVPVTTANGSDGSRSASSLDFVSCLPRTLETLHLSVNAVSRDGFAIDISRLSTSITSLILAINNHARVAPILDSLQALTSLHSLSLKLTETQAELKLSSEASLQPTKAAFSFSMLPKTLKNFKFLGSLCSTGMRPELISELPTSLTSLSVAHNDLTWALAFRSAFPNASIELMTPIDAWSSTFDGGRLPTEFPEHWRLTLDNVAYERSIMQKYNAQKIFLTCDWDSTLLRTNALKEVTTFIFHAPPSHRGQMNPPFPRFGSLDFGACMPNLQKLVLRLHPNKARSLCTHEIPSTLTHLELVNVSIAYSGNGNAHLLPPTLTHIECDSPFDTAKRVLTFKLVPKLCYLNTPWWNWRVSSLNSWTDKGMEKLYAHLSGLKDSQWLDFLKTNFHPKTLANMYVSLSYTHTGHLLSKQEAKLLIGRPLVEKRQATQYRLTALLQETIVPFAVPKSASKKAEAYVNRPLGMVVYEMHVDEKESRFYEA